MLCKTYRRQGYVRLVDFEETLENMSELETERVVPDVAKIEVT